MSTRTAAIGALAGLLVLPACIDIAARAPEPRSPTALPPVEGVALARGTCLVLRGGQVIDEDPRCREYDTPLASTDTVYARGTTRTYQWSTGSRTVVQRLENFQAINGVPGTTVTANLGGRPTRCVRNIETRNTFCFLSS